MSIVQKSWFVAGTAGFALTALVWLAGGCSTDSAGGSSSNSAELATIEDDLKTTQGSFAAARGASDACLQTFRACREGADASDESCREALQDCLPSEPPAPAACGDRDDRGDDRAGGRGRRDGGAGAEPLPSFGVDAGAGPGSRGEDGTRHDDDDDRGRVRTDGGVRGRPDGGAFGPRGGDEDGARACRKPALRGDGMGACRERAAADLAGGGDPSAACDAHKQCVGRTFGGHIAELCEKANELCGGADAPAEACARITEACSAAPEAAL